tara:strand:+ start:415 stop:1866 length:1452 start_codon:yes stop_codon:yes gene_type:complete
MPHIAHPPVQSPKKQLKKIDPSVLFWAALALAAVVMLVRLELLHTLEATTGETTIVPLAKAALATNTNLSTDLDEWEEGTSSDSNESTPRRKRETDWEFVGPRPSPPLTLDTQPNHRVIRDTLRSGDSIYLSLKKNNVSEQQISLLNLALRDVFNASSRSRPRDTYRLVVDTSGVVLSFTYTPVREPERPVFIELVKDELVGKRQALPLDTREYAAEVFIEDNLANAISVLGESDALTDRITDNIFGSVIDFRLNTRKGDRIRILFEKEFLNDQFIRYGRVALAEYQGQIVQQNAYRYTPRGGSPGYFDGEGNSLARMFLLYPLPFRGINSHFNLRRFHPVLKRNVPHLGTDYAASHGTPVFATAIGTVTHAGNQGGYGLLVEIEHANGYRTRYAHLSKVLVKRGQRVAQQQTVGRVGSTGRSTGPHLHYEILKNGRQINPTSVNRGERGKPLKKKNMTTFQTHRDSLIDALNSHLQRTTSAP